MAKQIQIPISVPPEQAAEIRRGLDVLAVLLEATNGYHTTPNRSALVSQLGLLAAEPGGAQRLARALAPIFGVDLDAPIIL